MKTKVKIKKRLLATLLLLSMVISTFTPYIVQGATTGYHIEKHEDHQISQGNTISSMDGWCATCGAATVSVTLVYWYFECNNTIYAVYTCGSYMCYNTYCPNYGATLLTYEERDLATDEINDAVAITSIDQFWTLCPKTKSCPGYEAPNTYYVKYNGNNSTSGSMTNSTHTYDKAQNLTANAFKRTGYTFKNWNTNANGSGTSYADKKSVKNLTTTNKGTFNLYAQWTANQYTATYNANGGSVGTATKTVTYDSTYGTLATPTRTGFTFNGWKYGSTAITSSTKVTATANHTLTAQWTRNKYTVTYLTNGGTFDDGSTEKTAEVYYDYAVDLSPTASKDGRIFIGWATSTNDKACLTDKKMPANNITLYAMYSIPVSDVQKAELWAWNQNDKSKINKFPMTITSTDINGYNFSIDNVNVLSGLSYSNVSEISMAIMLYDNAGNITEIAVNGATPPTEEKYKQTVNHYIQNIETGEYDLHYSSPKIEVLKGETFTPTYLAESDENYPNGFSPSSIDAAYVVEGDTTTNAYYTANSYKLFFDANEGICDIEYKEVYPNYYIGELPTPTRDGYNFTGWYTQKEGGLKISDGDRFTHTSDQTVYAHWTARANTVTYDYWTNGGKSVSLSKAEVTYLNPIDLSVEAYKEGWEHIGWSTNPTDTTGMGSLPMDKKDITLYAIYKKDVSVTFIDATDTNTVSTTVPKTIYNNEKSAQISVPEQNVLTGFTSLGWSLDTPADATTHYSPGGFIKAYEPLTVYGCYMKNLTIFYDTNGSETPNHNQSAVWLYNASGSAIVPDFTIADGPTLDNYVFDEWTNANGNTYTPGQVIQITEDLYLTATWDKAPSLEAYNRYFTLDEAQSGKITETELLKKAKGTDEEDGTLKNGDDVIVLDYDPDDFKTLTDDAEVCITYKATDSRGNSVTKTVTVYVVDTVVRQTNIDRYIRFINLNIFSNITKHGGLEETSIWKTNPILYAYLEYVLSLEIPLTTYTFKFHN